MRRICRFLIVVLVLTGCRVDETSLATDQPAATFDVHAAGFLFEPAQLVVPAGTTVTWTNDDKILHTVTSGTPESPTDGFDRQLDGKGTSASIVFTETGEYQYFCSRHPHMTGVVRVEEAGR